MRPAASSALFLCTALSILTSCASLAPNYFSVSAGGTRLATELTQRPKSGLSSFNEMRSYETGRLIGFAVGRQFHAPLRAEIEFSMRRHPGEHDTGTGLGGSYVRPANGDFVIRTLMLNGFYDVDRSWFLRPLLGLGVGIADVDLDWPSFTDGSDTVLAIQGIAGLAWRISNNVDLELRYRYTDTEDLQVSGPNIVRSPDTRSRAVEATFRLSF